MLLVLIGWVTVGSANDAAPMQQAAQGLERLLEHGQRLEPAAVSEAFRRVERAGTHFVRRGPRTDAAVWGSVLASYARRARERYEGGERSTLEVRARTVASMCMGCHTRGASPFARTHGHRFASLAPLDRARALAATRQFSESFNLDEQLLREGSPAEAMEALADGLSLAVRVFDDRARTKTLLTLAGSMNGPVATMLERDRAGLAAWEAEGEPATLQQLLEQVDRISALRAMALASRKLESAKTPEARAMLLFQLAEAASRAGSGSTLEIDLVALQACVEEAPHTPIARQCFGRLEQEVIAGFTGSRGTEVPLDEQRRLEALRSLSGVGPGDAATKTVNPNHRGADHEPERHH